MQDRVLIVDDEPLICKSLSEVIKRAGYSAHVASDGYEALQAIQQEQFSVVITDMSMPKMNGLEVMQRARTLSPDIAVIIITGYATIDSAVEAMRYGAYDYITKPFSPNKIKDVIREAIEHTPFRNAVQYDPENANIHQSAPQIVTADPQMLDILNEVKLIAQTGSTVLVQGESGTGKEMIAKAIHKNSRRSAKPYVAVNCAALPEGLIESELFGHEKGSFTGAIARRIGMLEMAHGGTILLDEVSEMAMPFQAKLLRAIQEREIVRVGGTHPISLDVRIVATTNKNLSEEVDNGDFREDLFYRLCVIPIHLPPLRERKGDIPILAQYFTQRFCTRMGKGAKVISEEAMAALKSYPWHGNIRELENTIERAVALSQNGTISPEALFFSRRGKRPSKYVALEVGTSLHDAEQELILRTLKDMGGNKQKAAEVLGITSKTIRSKLRQYGYDSPLSPESPDQ